MVVNGDDARRLISDSMAAMGGVMLGSSRIKSLLVAIMSNSVDGGFSSALGVLGVRGGVESDAAKVSAR